MLTYTEARGGAPSGPEARGGETASVGELGRELGVSPRTLRFYEDKGLLTPRRAGNARIYTPRDRARMILILRGKRLGFSLREIKDYLDLYDVDTSQGEQLRMLLKAVGRRLVQLEEQRRALEQTIGELRDIERQVTVALGEAAGPEAAGARQTGADAPVPAEPDPAAAREPRRVAPQEEFAQPGPPRGTAGRRRSR